MTVVTLTFTASVEEITSGIPQNVTIESNIPSTVYYTTDGSMPTVDSLIYIDPINLPTGMDSVILSAFGVDSNNIAGPILTQTFAANTTRISVGRNVGMEGFVLDREWIGPNIPDRYGPIGNPENATFLDVDPEFLHMTANQKGFNGVEPGTKIFVGTDEDGYFWSNPSINIPSPKPVEGRIDVDERFIEFSTTEKAQYFDPNARYIVNDERKNNEIKYTTRPYGSFSDIYREYGGKRIREVGDDGCYVSGGYVGRFYSGRTNTMVSYFFDHNEARWIKNIQKLPNNIQMPNNIGVNSHGQPLVFPWIPRGRQSGLV